MKKARKTIKNLAGLLLAVALLLSAVQPISVAAADLSESNSSVVAPMLEPSDIEYVGTTAFGTMLTEKMLEKQTEETGSTSYIRNATYNGWYVDVELENSENATLVVALYDETGETMYASASQSVTEDTDACSLHPDGEIPDYFLLKAFLIGYRDNVICDEYVSYLYTQEMQTLLNSTVEDYPDREILQLDDSGDNNFAVYGENAVVVSSTNSANTVIHADEETGSYVVEHIEDALRTLDKGDILSLEQPDGTTWILKVESVSITGDTATITAANAEMEEVFDFVKVDTTSREGEINVDNSNLSDGITCQSVDIDSPAKRAYEGDISRSVEVAYDIDKTIAGTQSNNVKFKGSIGFTLGFQLEYYLSLNYSSLKFSIPYTFEVSAAITGKVTAWECPLCDIGFSPIPGVYIGLTPAIVLELSVALEFSFQSEAVLGYEITTGLFRGTEIQNASKAPVTSSELKLEGKVFFGLSLRPHVAIISKHIADAGMTGTAGIEFSAGMNLWEYNAETNHLCDSCLAGELGWRMELSVDIKLLNSIKIEATILEASQKICDFYYSFTKSEFGWGTCPYVYDKTHGEIVDIGECGEKAKWLLFTDGHLMICGDGAVSPSYEWGVDLSAVSSTEIGKDISELYAYADHDLYLYAVRLWPDVDTITVDPRNRYFASFDNVLFDVRKSTLIYATDTRDSYTIPDTVTKLDFGAFSYCRNLVEMTIPGTVESIGSCSFQGTSLESVTIQDGVKYIEPGCFSYCPNLRSVIFPESIREVVGFEDCVNLSSVTFPKNLETLGGFGNCSNLTKIVFKGDVPNLWLSNITFSGVTADVYYPANNPTWTREAMEKFGGDLTWIPYSGEAPQSYLGERSVSHGPEPGAEELKTASFSGLEPGENCILVVATSKYDPLNNLLYIDQKRADEKGNAVFRYRLQGEYDEIYVMAYDEATEEPKEPVSNPFADVKESQYYYAPILWAVQQGITNGTTPTTFSPENPCTRGQIVTFLWRAFGSPEPKSSRNPFSDVPANVYYYKAILWAVEQGITTGTSATTFSPEATCTRGQVATFLWRACGKPAPKGSGSPFSDVPKTVYYYEPILWAVEQGITNGTGNGQFSPEASCTRGQIVTFLYRALAE